MTLAKVAKLSSRLQRPELLHLLEHSHTVALTLIVAPAGSGKSTLLQQWQQQHAQRCFVSLALKRQDADVRLFVRHLYQALSQHLSIPNTLFLNSFEPSPDYITHLTHILLEAFEVLTEDFFILLDDFHYASSPYIQQFFTQLTAALAPQVHIIIASRTQPQFSLSRLKLNDQLFVIDNHHLRLAHTQLDAFCAVLQQSALSHEESTALFQLTEGWVAGIKLALLARAKTGSLLAQHIQGSQSEVMAYFMDVVLAELEPPLREFLWASSIFEHFDLQTIQFLLPHLECQALILATFQQNLFISTTDDGSLSFRYHPLFREFLRLRLQQEPQAYIHQLHHRAAHYFLAIAQPTLALSHAQQCHHPSDFYACLEQCCTQWLKEGQLHLLLSWLNQIPFVERIRYPELVLLHLSALIFSRLFNEASALIQQVKTQHMHSYTASLQERLAFLENVFFLLSHDVFDPNTTLTQIKLNQQFHDIRDAAPIFLARYMMLQGDYEMAIRYANHSKTLLASLNHAYLSSFADVIIVLSERELGHAHIAQPMTQAFFNRYAAFPNTPCWTNAATCMVVNLYEQGRHAEAFVLCKQLINDIDSACASELIFYVYITLARLHAQTSQRQAIQYFAQLRRILQLGQHNRLLHQLLVQELSHAIQTDNKERIQCIAHDYELAIKIQHHTWQQAPQCYNEAWLYGGLAAALYLRSKKQYDEALAILAVLNRHLIGTQMRLRLAVVKANQAVILALQGQQQEAYAILSALLARLGLHTITRTVFDEAPHVTDLLKTGHAQGFIALPQKYLDTYPELLRSEAAPTPITAIPNNMLTQKEQEILELVQQGRSNKEICHTLSISLSTTKWHIKNIFSKLHITNRASAIALTLSKQTITHKFKTFIASLCSLSLYTEQATSPYLAYALPLI